MSTERGFDVIQMIRYLHDQLVPRLEELQECYNRHEFESPAIAALQHDVERLTTTAEILEAGAEAHGALLVATLCDALGYAGREASMGTPFKGLSALADLRTQLDVLLP
jgi:hypothetical protein